MPVFGDRSEGGSRKVRVATIVREKDMVQLKKSWCSATDFQKYNGREQHTEIKSGSNRLRQRRKLKCLEQWGLLRRGWSVALSGLLLTLACVPLASCQRQRLQVTSSAISCEERVSPSMSAFVGESDGR